jgi:S1/P1 Nuclease
MESMFSFSTDEFQVYNVTQWAVESYDLTRYSVYTGVKEYTAPSADYVQRNQNLIQRQIVLGGLRLANII